MTSVVTLVGGAPWGFRIQGGRGTGQPLRISKVSSGGRAWSVGVREGDFVRAVRGRCADDLSQEEVRHLISGEEAPVLSMELERRNEDNFDVNGHHEISVSESPDVGPAVQACDVTPCLRPSDVRNSPSFLDQLFRNRPGPTTPEPPSGHFGNTRSEFGSPRNPIVTSPPPPPPLPSAVRKGIAVGMPNTNLGSKSRNEETSFEFHPPPVTATYQSRNVPGSRIKSESPPTIVTASSPPPGSILLEERVTYDEGAGLSHTDRIYGLPLKEELRETTRTAHFIPAPPKYEGIGPLEDGLPIAPRNSVKKENMHDWYKTMFKSLHKTDLPNDNQEYMIGYSSEPETSRRERSRGGNKSATIDHRLESPDSSPRLRIRNFGPVQHSPPSTQTNGHSHPKVQHSEVHRITAPAPSPNHLSPRSPYSNPGSRSPSRSPARSPDQKIHARALFHFKAESVKELPLRKDDCVLIHKQLDRNWYEGEHQGRVGMFPVSYVQILSEEQARSQGSAQVLYDFTAHGPAEISVRKGEAVTLIRRVDDSWIEVTRGTGPKGIVPAAYLRVTREPAERASLSPLPCLRSPSSPGRPSSHSPVVQSTTREVTFKESGLIEPLMCRALFDYSPAHSDELELREGDAICVVERCADGWCAGTSSRTGRMGLFPGNYVEPLGRGN